MLTTILATATASAAEVAELHIEGLITDLAFILILGAITTVFFKWIKQPVVLGYIVAGFLASPNFEYLPSVTTESNIEFWAQIGIVVLLFSLGLEFSFKKLINAGGSAVVTALIIVTGMMGAGIAIGHFLGFSNIDCIFLGGMLSMSSTTIIIKAFNDLHLSHKKFASQVFAVLIVEDLFAVLMMVILSSIAINNSVEGGEMLMSIGKLVFFLIMWFLVGVYVLPSLLNRTRNFLNSETLLIVSMGLCLGMAVFSVYCGFSMALGAFVMGSILAGTSFAERIEHVTMPVKDLFGSVFFISVGMMVDPHVIGAYYTPIIAISLVVIIGMLVFGTLGMLLTGQTLKVAMESGFSLTQIGEFAFIIASLGMSLGVLDPSIYPIVVAVSVLTTFTTPYFIRMADPAYNFVSAHLPKRLKFLIERYEKEAITEKASGKLWTVVVRRYVVRILVYSALLLTICILGTRWLLPLLRSISPEWGSLACAVIGLAAMSPFLIALTFPTTKKSERRALLETMPKFNVPLIILSIFRMLLAIGFTANFLSAIYGAAIGLVAGVIVFFIIIFVLSRRLRNRMRRMEDRFMNNLNERELRRSGKNLNIVSNLHLARMVVGYECPFVGERLKDSGLRSRYGVNLAAINRGDNVIPLPGAETRIFPGDVLTLIGSDEQIQRLIPIVEATAQPGSETTSAQSYKFELINFNLSDSSPLIGTTVATSGISDRYSALLVTMMRNGEYITPEPSTQFMPGDILWIVGDPQKTAALK